MGHNENMLRPATPGERLPLEDRADILDLIALYPLTFDDQCVDEWVNLFTEDAFLEYSWDFGKQRRPYEFGSGPQFYVKGHDQLRQFALNDKAFAEKGGTIVRRHTQPNTVIRRVSDDVAVATSLTLITFYGAEGSGDWYPPAHHAPTYITGFYRDEFAKLDVGWRFSARSGIFDPAMPPQWGGQYVDPPARP
jgi:hypothetical protein